jgi:hypothetical protein
MRYSAQHSRVKAKPKNISNFDVRTAGLIGNDPVHALSAILETEYLHLLPVIEFNNSTELRSAGKPA